MLASTARGKGLARTWDARVPSWERHVQTHAAFEQIRGAVLDAAVVGRRDVVVDLGAGTGFLSLPLAARAGHVIAVDVSAAMLADLEHSAHDRAQANVMTVVADLAAYDLPAECVDVVVSSYALHHLTDADKTLLLARVHRWLKPGGQLIVADMMFGRGGSSRDRSILRSKVVALARKGPGGWWRIVKNVVRLGLRLGHERPASPTFWKSRALAAGFTSVTCRPLVAEAGLLVARKKSGGEPNQAPAPAADVG